VDGGRLLERWNGEGRRIGGGRGRRSTRRRANHDAEKKTAAPVIDGSVIQSLEGEDEVDLGGDRET
jgi:hypothetical protein